MAETWVSESAKQIDGREQGGRTQPFFGDRRNKSSPNQITGASDAHREYKLEIA